ncbi:MAG: DUF2147 domain-containing protein [Bacteroidetes bacterium]|nr:MAG: DUF2147 domain-containing protein [Bacteroidota bacterium]
MKKIVTTVAGLILVVALFAQNPDAIVGVWKNGEGTALIKIFKNKDKYQGKIVWLKEPNDPETGLPKVDKNHPDAAVRTRPIVGMSNVWGFEYKAAENEWSGGFIYDPKNGKTYDCVISLKTDNELNVRGFIMGMSMFGRTDTWARQMAKS